MFKEYVRGYKNVGASLEDFKNFTRYVKKYIKNSDAQMLIETLSRRKTMCSSFYWDFDVDKEGRLTRIFWADPIDIKNYTIFGDMVSFDTTFDMNKYKMGFAPFTGVDHHKRCVTFAAGLLANESVESFTWLFECFVKAMSGRYPSCIITDQDLGIKGGVERVFGDKTHHRYCMWHILKKLTEKVGSTLCKETAFLTDFNACVWGEDVEPDEFEETWSKVISSYDLSGNQWLKQIYEMRKSWVPAYFRELFLGGLMRTTSRSESENNFFNNFTNQHLTLLEFWMRFDSAMDAQRWKQSKLIADSKNSSPMLFSPLSIEKHAAATYTPTIFYEFQQELKAACYSCAVESLSEEGTIEHNLIKDRERNKVHIVDFLLDGAKFSCTCKKFERHGILCRHVLMVIKDKGFEEVPSQYMINRWRKLASCKPCFDIDGKFIADCTSMDVRKNKVSELWSEMFSCVSIAEQKTEYVEDLLDLLRGFKEKTNVDNGSSNGKKKDKKAELEMLIGTSIPDEVTVLPPKQSKNKGSGKRLVSEREKAIEESKKIQRKCGYCGQMTTHDFRNCPGRKKTPSKKAPSKRVLRSGTN